MRKVSLAVSLSLAIAASLYWVVSHDTGGSEAEVVADVPVQQDEQEERLQAFDQDEENDWEGAFERSKPIARFDTDASPRSSSVNIDSNLIAQQLGEDDFDDGMAYTDTADTQWLASVEHNDDRLGSLESIREYKQTLQEAYQVAKESNDRGFLKEVIVELREVGVVEAKLSGKEINPGKRESDQLLAKNDETNAPIDHRDQQPQYDCRKPSVPGEFVCPCPSDPFYTERWREAYNPEFLADKNCKY